MSVDPKCDRRAEVDRDTGCLMAGTKIKSVAAGRVEDAWWLTSVGSWTNALVVLATQSVVYV
jgi:hypothetical protein